MKKREKILMLILVCAMFALTACGSDGKSDGNTGDINAKNTTDGDADTDDGSNQDKCDTAAFDAECKIGCPYGYDDGEDGCRICKCRETEMPGYCEAITCPERCEGYILDENSCATCECGAPDGDDGSNQDKCDTAAFDAECKIGCPYGYDDGEDGCRICKCRETEMPGYCEAITCPERCEGYILDENSCATCECGK